MTFDTMVITSSSTHITHLAQREDENFIGYLKRSYAPAIKLVTNLFLILTALLVLFRYTYTGQESANLGKETCSCSITSSLSAYKPFLINGFILATELDRENPDSLYRHV